MIKLLRIDDRLIHGQVAMAWTKAKGVDHIIVVDDESEKDKMKKMILSLAKPSSTDLDIVSVENFKNVYDKNKDRNLMIVAGSTKTALAILNTISSDAYEINLGGIRHKEGRHKITEHVFLSDEEKDDLAKINDLGIDIVMQATPNGTKSVYK